MRLESHQRIQELLEKGRGGAGPANQAALTEAQVETMKLIEGALLDVESSTSSVEDSIIKLHQTIERSEETNSRYTRWLIGLTIIIVILTAVMAIPIAERLFLWLGENGSGTFLKLERYLQELG